ncbi:hypothetical protein ACWKWU_22245 [Chitinophaga lutea]
MLHFRYTPFLSVSVKHIFYKNAHARDVTFTPSPSTAATLDALGLKARQTDGNFVLYRKLDADGIPETAPDAVTDLYFGLQVRTDLLNITESFGSGRYWLSNLQEDGSYLTDLILDEAHVLPEVYALRKTLHFPAGVVDKIHLQKLASPGGWTFDRTLPVSPVGEARVELRQPGLYRMEKVLSAGGSETVTAVFSDEAAARNTWAILHLQLQPDMEDLDFTLTLPSRKSTWKYFLVEPFGRPGSAVDPAALSISYSTGAGSRYPDGVSINALEPEDEDLAYVNGLMADGSIKSVHLFASDAELEILDGEQPEVRLEMDGGSPVGRISTPDRSMKQTTIIYKL